MEQKSDAELVELARAGDKDAFGVLAVRHGEMVCRVALRIVGRADDAQELANEAILQAYLGLPHLRAPQRFAGWLYGITVNVCRSHLRDQGSRPISLDSLAGGLSFDTTALVCLEPSLEEVVEAQELHQSVMQAIAELSPDNRAATLLFYYEGLSLREIAAILGISVVAVKGRLHRSRHQLRERLLPVHQHDAGRMPSIAERDTMIKVAIVDVVTTGQYRADAQDVNDIIILHDEPGRQVLPIWVGKYEAESIRIQLMGVQTARPVTYRWMANLLEAVHARLVEVRVETLKDDVFYAVAQLAVGDGVQEVDARPSDALNLALIAGCPIYVSDEIMSRAGIAIPEGQQLQQRKGLTSTGSEIAQAMEKFQARPPLTEEERRQMHEANERELLAYITAGTE